MKDVIERLRKEVFDTYKAATNNIHEHYGKEVEVLGGGYGYRQVFELVQNAADAILEGASDTESDSPDGRIEICLEPDALSVANTGAPLSEAGLEALIYANISPKRGNQIGRFGIGFKSVLALKGKIEFYFRDGSGILFDPERCRKEIRDRYRVDEAPGLRLVWWIDPDQPDDARIKEKFPWATTIVRAHLGDESISDRLAKELGEFPAEFLLFLDTPVEIVMDGPRIGHRALRREPGEHRCRLYDNEEATDWHTFTRLVKIDDDEARNDATHLHEREAVPLHWAMPSESGRARAGRFWAFFPTETPTKIAGILNAPWKLGTDRTSLISGPYNDYLLREAAALVAESLPALVDPDDPGIVLDAFPRELERQDELAAPLVDELWSRLTQEPAVPDGLGVLRLAAELKSHPVEDEELCRLWWEAAPEEVRRAYVHPSCHKSNRLPRLKRLAEKLNDREDKPEGPCLGAADIADWFEEIASIDTARAAKVLHLAAAYAEMDPNRDWQELRQRIAIVPGADGNLYPATRVVLCEDGEAPLDYVAVNASIAADEELCSLLNKALGVNQVAGQFWKNELGRSLANAERTGDYDTLWKIIRAAPENERNQFSQRNRDQINVRSRAGEWKLAYEVLATGGLLLPGEAEHDGIMLDERYHREDTAILDSLGIERNIVADTRSIEDDPWQSFFRAYCKEWFEHCVDRYEKKLLACYRGKGGPPGPKYVSMPKSFQLILAMRKAVRSEATIQLCEHASSGYADAKVKFHKDRAPQYATYDFPHPLPWFVLRHGTVWIGNQSVFLAAVAARIDSPGLAAWPERGDWKERIEGLGDLQPPIEPTKEDLHTLWQGLTEACDTSEALERDDLGALWKAAAMDGFVPAEFSTERGDIPLAEVGVTTAPAVAEAARKGGRVALTLDPDTLVEWVAKGAQDLGSDITPLYGDGEGETAALTDAFPELEGVLSESGKAATCRPVEDLRLKVGASEVPAPCFVADGTLLCDAEQLRALDPTEYWTAILHEILRADWLSCGFAEALRRIADVELIERRKRVAAGATLAEKLALAVNHDVEALRNALDSLGDADFVGDLDAIGLAELVLVRHGPASLSVLKGALETAELQPPNQWGRDSALEFVTEIGFPSEFSVAGTSPRHPEVEVDGPDPLPPLHDFQEEVFEHIQELRNKSSQRRRAVVCLPTGAGKTRVVGEAAVRLFLSDPNGSRLVLWVAQTDELCEQAVQALRSLWLNFGKERTPLRIARLWGGNRKPKPQTPGAPTVVVASIQTLERRAHDADLDWLSRPDLVVLDECHHAITPSYTKVLRWLDAMPTGKTDPEKPEPMLLGLSATPFRVDEVEAERLSARFDKTWFPSNQETLYAKLRADGVLTDWSYERFDSGATGPEGILAKLAIAEERRAATQFDNLWEELNEFLGRQEDRNAKIMDFILGAKEQRILLFANSVEHAELLSLRLHRAGIPAAAVSGKSPRHVRRYFLRQFREGELRVLCNHTVLSTGFDEPGVDLVLIARQVYSPVRYMQMVGRGLRGPKNGGTERCRIVTVMDNLGRFEEKHPYHFCRQYYESVSAAEPNEPSRSQK